MSDSGRSMDVLKKILGTGAIQKKIEKNPDQLVEKYLQPEKVSKRATRKRPGRPKVDDKFKAKNFTLCLAPKYLSFLDSMQMKDKKIQGRGRKIRYIIDQFLELHRRQKGQLEVLKKVLIDIEIVLKGFSAQVKKGQKLELTPRERGEITKAVGQFQVLIKVLGFSPKELHRMLPPSEWAIASFCFDWSKKI